MYIETNLFAEYIVVPMKQLLDIRKAQSIGWAFRIFAALTLYLIDLQGEYGTGN